MKKIVWVALLLSACKKDKSEYVTVKMKDAISGVSLKQGYVSFFKCTAADPLCGLIPWKTLSTDNSGTCQISSNEFSIVTYMRSTKDGYWMKWEPPVSSVLLVPDGWIRLRITRGTAYPGAILRIIITEPYSNMSEVRDFHPAADSTILLRGFGDQVNRMNWEVVDPGGNQVTGGNWNQMVPRHDTISTHLTY